MIQKIKRAFEARKIRKEQSKFLRNLPSAYDNSDITWTALEHVKHERGILWKILVIISVWVGAIIGIIYNAWTFSLAIVVFAGVYYIVHKNDPKEVEVKLSNIGVKIGDRKYPYAKIKAFWIVYEPPYVKNLYIRVAGDLAFDIPVQLNDKDPSEVREFLINKIPELEGKSESMTDIFLRLFKI